MDSTYGPDTLYNYINGGAEVYIALNFKAVFARRFEKAGEPELICDLFDMGSAYDAFGAYHHDMREGPSGNVGRESEISNTSLAFWKGPYFVSIVAFDDTPAAQVAMKSLGIAVANALPDDGEPPPLLKVLPEDDLQRSRLHYFHDHLTLHSHYLLARDNVLGLSPETNCLLARYTRTSSNQDDLDWVLLIVDYPADDLAEEASAALFRKVLPGADAAGSVRRSDGSFAAARTIGKTLLIALDAPSRQQALSAIADSAVRVVGWQ